MNKISRKLRLASMLLDHAIICFTFIPPIIFINKSFVSDENAIQCLMIPVLAFYLCKDCIDGRSPAKRILKLSVVRSGTKAPATPFQTLLRNLFIFIWPIEVIIACLNQEKRLGDRVAGTELQFYNGRKNSKVEIGKIIGCFLLALVIFYLLSQVSILI